MAKEIVWTETAVRDRLRIYQFWLSHNQSQIYSDKLERLFNESAKLIAEFPEIGSITDYKEIRVKTVGNHKLFYKPGGTKLRSSEFGTRDRILTKLTSDKQANLAPVFAGSSLASWNVGGGDLDRPIMVAVS